jgi:hypothetical protein
VTFHLSVRGPSERPGMSLYVDQTNLQASAPRTMELGQKVVRECLIEYNLCMSTWGRSSNDEINEHLSSLRERQCHLSNLEPTPTPTLLDSAEQQKSLTWIIDSSNLTWKATSQIQSVLLCILIFEWKNCLKGLNYPGVLLLGSLVYLFLLYEVLLIQDAKATPTVGVFSYGPFTRTAGSVDAYARSVRCA